MQPLGQQHQHLNRLLEARPDLVEVRSCITIAADLALLLASWLRHAFVCDSITIDHSKH